MIRNSIALSLCFLLCHGVPLQNVQDIRTNQQNPELNGGGVEGDMIFPIRSEMTRGVGILGQYRRWPDAVIPYDISRITNPAERNLIQDAMNQLMFDVGTPIPGQVARKVCVFFRPAVATDKEILTIQHGVGCSASVGYFTNYNKVMSLQSNGCFQSGIVQHELLHVLGFFHEQSRPDRDSFITVNQANIQDNQLHNFEKYQWNVDVENQNFSYDYGSIMHYPQDAFSKNGLPTITSKRANAPLGQRNKLSQTDIDEVRHYYRC